MDPGQSSCWFIYRISGLIVAWRKLLLHGESLDLVWCSWNVWNKRRFVLVIHQLIIVVSTHIFTYSSNNSKGTENGDGWIIHSCSISQRRVVFHNLKTLMIIWLKTKLSQWQPGYMSNSSDRVVLKMLQKNILFVFAPLQSCHPLRLTGVGSVLFCLYDALALLWYLKIIDSMVLRALSTECRACNVVAQYTRFIPSLSGVGGNPAGTDFYRAWFVACSSSIW